MVKQSKYIFFQFNSLKAFSAYLFVHAFTKGHNGNRLKDNTDSIKWPLPG